MSKLLIPNTTQVPNILLDRLMPILPPAPLKVLLVITWFTYGFQKRSDRIGFKQLACAAGLSRRSAIDAVKFLGDLINRNPGGPGRGANEYSLNLNVSEAQILALSQRSSEPGRTSEGDCTSALPRKKVVKDTAPFQTNISKPNKSSAKAPKSSPSRREKKPTRSDPAVLSAFDQFYQVYPRHVARQEALNAWLKLQPDTELIEKIMGAVGAYAAQSEGTESKFIQYPKKWLNGRRWEDEPADSIGNAHGPPAFKDLGSGLVEINGLKMTHERL